MDFSIRLQLFIYLCFKFAHYIVMCLIAYLLSRFDNFKHSCKIVEKFYEDHLA